MTQTPLMLESITDAGAEAQDRIAICGSHGGTVAATLASRAGLRAVVLNDAGVGLNEAGIRGVLSLDQIGMAAAAVDCRSARIGSAYDMQETGVLSVVNDTAEALGLCKGQTVGQAVALLVNAPSPNDRLPKLSEARMEITLLPDVAPVLCADSASLIRPDDVGRFIVTGSHGGLIGNDPARACKAHAGFVCFNDAGRGKDDVGLGRLAPLQDQGVPAAVLDHNSCEIGDARSALETGVVSGSNALAQKLGVRKGDLLREFLSRAMA